MPCVTEIKTFAALGSGVIGSGWVARALAHSLDVVAWDPAPGAEAALRARIAKCWGALDKQGLKAGASQQRLRFVPTIEECVAKADFIQESAPETLGLKIALHEKVAAAARPDVLIGSSTSGLLPSEFYAKAAHPERCVVGHPFNPVYLLPLVEVVGGAQTSPDAIQAAITVYKSLGMKPLMCARRCRASSPTVCWRPCGANPCTWSMTVWPPPARSTMRSVTALVSAGRSWAAF